MFLVKLHYEEKIQVVPIIWVTQYGEIDHMGIPDWTSFSWFGIFVKNQNLIAVDEIAQNAITFPAFRHVVCATSCLYWQN